ncbi:MAG TPA: hypothetical protein VI072_02310 [Polyangiaceae bacterium]
MMKNVGLAVCLGVLSLSLAACGGTDEDLKGGGGSGGSGGSGGGGECENSMTSFKGDCLKLEKPDPKLGFQLHFGPKSYDDAAEVAKFTLAPGEETNACLYMTTPNEEQVFFYDYDSTVRPGTHHMIIFSAKESEKPDGLFEGDCPAIPGLEWSFMVGAQNGIDPAGARIKVPEDGKPLASENKGMAMILPPKTRIAYTVHFVNQSRDEGILQESWANFKYMEPAKVTQPAATLFWIGGLNMEVPPRQRQVIEGECTNLEDTPRRLVTITGHVHANTTRFTAYKIPANDPTNKQRVYEIYDWAHADLFYYDSANKNPLPNRERGIPGASTGELVLAKGDKLRWECDVFNRTDKVLTFGNEAYTAEMCNVFGLSAPLPENGANTWNCYSVAKVQENPDPPMP